ncbi:MAG: hypothetical protein KC486_36510 [Myxococcales bacterium]|nr:hypothetical protein [Myxococcales bacterium]
MRTLHALALSLAVASPALILGCVVEIEEESASSGDYESESGESDDTGESGESGDTGEGDCQDLLNDCQQLSASSFSASRQSFRRS